MRPSGAGARNGYICFSVCCVKSLCVLITTVRIECGYSCKITSSRRCCKAHTMGMSWVCDNMCMTRHLLCSQCHLIGSAGISSAVCIPRTYDKPVSQIRCAACPIAKMPAFRYLSTPPHMAMTPDGMEEDVLLNPAFKIMFTSI